ncbi:PKD2L1 [Branchiostoma lanceolatum]|uniref:PKD2L1 protein n=1 Tax=Branchiostoma lanceolatum TaxID=7740 RepID=A0A8J9ZFQ7_BRALA|nr:PKD2L1 [Branchiostoma lanceolatum]
MSCLQIYSYALGQQEIQDDQNTCDDLETCGLSAFCHVPQTDCAPWEHMIRHRGVTLQSCAEACCADPACLSFQYVTQHSDCYLKNKVCSAEEKVPLAIGNMYDRIELPDFEHVRTTIADAKIFQWDLELPRSLLLTFRVRASKGVLIALSSEGYDLVDMYRIIIGGWDNTKSVIRRTPGGASQTTAFTSGILSADGLRGFWVSWAADGTIAVGREGEGSPFMQWQDPYPLPIDYFGYTTGLNSAGLFRFPCHSGCQLLLVNLPENVTCGSTTTSSLAVQWMHPCGSLSGYRVWYQEVLDDAEPSELTIAQIVGGTNVVIEGIKSGSAYNVTVRAVSADGTAESGDVTVQCITETDVPRFLACAEATLSSIGVSWTHPQSPLIGYRTNCTDGTATTVTADLQAGRQSYELQDVQADREYHVTLVAVGVYRDSLPVSVTCATMTPPPEDLKVTTVSGTSVKASWTPTTSSIAIGYKVWIRKQESADAIFTRFLPISQTDVTFKDLIPATEYIISAATINMRIEGPEVHIIVATDTVPPSALDVEDRTIDTVVISWLPPKGVLVEYSITYTSNGRSTAVTSPGGAHSCELTGLVPGAEYDIDVVAVSKLGRSITASTSVVTDTDPPSSLEVSSSAATWMVLEWKAPLARVVSYEITVSETFSKELFSVDEHKTSYNVTDLLPETDYVIKMVAVSEHGRSVEATNSKRTGSVPLPVTHPITPTHTTTEAYTTVPWGDTSAISTSSSSRSKSTTTQRITATSAETTIQGSTEDSKTDRQTTITYSTGKEERPLDKTTSSTSLVQITEDPVGKLQHILQGVDEEHLESGNPEEILSVLSIINDVITTGDESSMSASAMEDAVALVEKLTSASRGAQGASITNMASIAKALTQTASSVINSLPEQQPPIASSSDNLFESDLIDTNSADLSPKQQLKMLKDKQKEKEDMQRRAALNILESLKGVAGTLLALQPGDAEYQATFGTEEVGITVSRSPSNKTLRLGNGRTNVTISQTSNGTQTNSMLDLKMLAFKKNPYSWKQSTGGQNISSPVTILSMNTRESEKGPKPQRRGAASLSEERQVNLDIPFVPSQEGGQTADTSHVTTREPRTTDPESSINGTNGTTMTYHRFSVPKGNVIPVLHMTWWDIDATFHVYSLYGSKPTVDKYDEKRVIQQEDGLEAWLMETNFTVSFTPNTTRRGDVLYIGVLKIDRDGYSSEKHKRESTMQPKETSDYKLWIQAVGCSSWEENNEQWELEQCDAKLDIDNNVFHCQCRVVTSNIAVGTISLPVPNSIDFLNAFNNLGNVGDNSVVFSIVVVKYILYIIIMVLLCTDFSRLRGKIPETQRKTLSKVSLIPPDRMPAPHVYQLTVTTGSMFGAGTTSRIGFQLFGSEGTTPIKMLNPEGEALVRGSTLHFVMPVRESLGEVMSLHIWHDNSGEGDTPSWFLGSFVVRDVEKDVVSFFCCHDWLSEDKGDGEVQKVVHASPKEELSSFSNVFTEATSDLLYDKHLWASALVAAPGSSFTQAQRLSCCFTLLNTMMLTSAMWYKADENTTAEPRVYNIGIARFTAEVLYTSLMTALTVAPVTLMIVQLFRMEAPLSANTPEMTIKTSWQGRLKKRLHRWVKYVAWVTVFLVSTTSAFFVILYSMDWGKEKSDSWMKAFILSFMGSSCVVDTLQIVVLAVVLSAVCNLQFLNKPPAIRKEDLQLNLWNSAAPKKIRPPTKANCQAARKKRELSKKSTSTLSEFLLLLIFVALLFYIAQTNNDQRVFYETRTLSNTILREFDEIRTPDQFYMWTEEVLLLTLYPSVWYNGRKMKFLDRQFAQNTESFRVGPPRLVQVRRRPGTCF